MAIRDTNGHAGVALAGGPEELWPVSGSEAAEPPDWRSLYERERERAEAAEARAEESRWAEVRAALYPQVQPGRSLSYRLLVRFSLMSLS
jgi:hypothetical protein